MGCNSSTNSFPLEKTPKAPDADINGLSTRFTPNKPKDVYLNQAQTYFNFLVTNLDVHVNPDYSFGLIRWEWPPWLVLTGLGSHSTLKIDENIRKGGPCLCPNQEHRFFDQNPFVRSRITFYYGKTAEEDSKTGTNAIHIYEEFTFNSFGQITFIEAWWDNPENLNLPKTLGKGWCTWPQLPPRESDGWPPLEINRMSSKIPGLGCGRRSMLSSDSLKEAAKKDPYVKEFRERLEHFAGEIMVTGAEQTLANIMGLRPSNLVL